MEQKDLVLVQMAWFQLQQTMPRAQQELLLLIAKELEATPQELVSAINAVADKAPAVNQEEQKEWKKLWEVLLKSTKPEAVLHFASHVSGADINEFKEMAIYVAECMRPKPPMPAFPQQET